MDLATAKQVRNSCKTGKSVKSAEFITKLCWLFTSPLFHLTAVIVTFSARLEMSRDFIHCLYERLFFFPVFLTSPSSPTPQVTRRDKDNFHCHGRAPQPGLSGFCDQQLSEQNPFDNRGKH